MFATGSAVSLAGVARRGGQAAAERLAVRVEAGPRREIRSVKHAALRDDPLELHRTKERVIERDGRLHLAAAKDVLTVRGPGQALGQPGSFRCKKLGASLANDGDRRRSICHRAGAKTRR